MLSFFDNLFDVFEAANEELFYVGGFVRDFLAFDKVLVEDLKNGKLDVDFATSAKPERTIQILKNAGLVPIPIGIEFGTIQVLIDGVKIEITTFRSSESYKKGSRKPAVVFGKSIQEDLARRDFTVNAIAMKRDGTLVDPFNGRDQLTVRALSTPIDPDISFSDDPLRMMRACRFQSRGFKLNERAFAAMQTLAEKIKEVSSERVFEEMSKILMSPKPAEGLKLMAQSGLLSHAFPELQKVVDFKQNQGKWHSKLVWDHTLQVVENTPLRLALRWSALYHDVAKPETYTETSTGVHFFQHDWKGALAWDKAADRLKVSAEFKNHVHLLVYEHLQPALLSAEGADHPSDTALRRLAHRLGDKLDDLFDLSLADITSHRANLVVKKKENCNLLRQRIKKILEQDNIPKLKLPTGLGNTLMNELNLKGRQLGVVMDALLDKLIDGELTLQSDFVSAARNIMEQKIHDNLLVECKLTIPNTFIACGEDGNYCSDNCLKASGSSNV